MKAHKEVRKEVECALSDATASASAPPPPPLPAAAADIFFFRVLACGAINGVSMYFCTTLPPIMTLRDKMSDSLRHT